VKEKSKNIAAPLGMGPMGDVYCTFQKAKITIDRNRIPVNGVEAVVGSMTNGTHSPEKTKGVKPIY